MTKQELLEMVEAIRASAGDPEHSHYLEDQMRRLVLLELAKSAVPEVAELAQIALSTDRIIDTRWYA